jgi:hypothetical protein
MRRVRLRIKVPAALVAQLGSHLDIEASVAFGHRGTEWAMRVAGRRAVRYDIGYDSSRGRWYLDASSKRDTVVVPSSIDELRTGPMLGVDLNADHLAACVLDGRGIRSGIRSRSPCAPPVWRRRGAMVGSARRSPPCSIPGDAGCTAVVIENLDIVDARA